MRTSPGTLGAALQTLPRTIELPNAGALESDLGVATASGHHGELLQGPVRLHESIETALVTLPDKRWHSRAHGKVTPHTGIEVVTTPHKPKVVAARHQPKEPSRLYLTKNRTPSEEVKLSLRKLGIPFIKRLAAKSKER